MFLLTRFSGLHRNAPPPSEYPHCLHHRRTASGTNLPPSPCHSGSGSFRSIEANDGKSQDGNQGASFKSIEENDPTDGNDLILLRMSYR